MELVDFWSVMKWVLLVLLAGFVGQFGKTFAQHVMKRVRKEPQPPAGAREDPNGKLPAVPQTGARPPSDLPAAYPAEKLAVLPTPAPADKKLLKGLAKQKKKEAKALQKEGKG